MKGIVWKEEKMAKKDYGMMTDGIIKCIGGKENIIFFTHCITRLRLNLKSKDGIDLNEIKKIDGVIGSQWAGDQLQIIIGQTVGDAYAVICEKYHLADVTRSKGPDEGGNPAENGKKGKKTVKERIVSVLDAVAGCVIPLVPMFVGGGMIKVLSMVLSLTHLISADGTTYYILEFIGDSAFYFLPIAVAVMAAKKFETDMALAVFLGGVLIHPNFINAVNEGKILSLFGIPVTAASYANQVLPSILIVWLLSIVEKKLKKIIPSYLRALGVPFLCALIMAPISLWILAPLGYIVGNYIVTGLMAFANATGFFGMGIIAALYPLMVLTGMHSILMPYIVQSFASYGFEAIVGLGIFVANFAQAAASLAVGVKSKDPDTKTTGISCFSTVVLAGVTEPALYGINLPKRKPLIGAMVGSLAGGCLGGLLSVKTYAFPGGSSIFAIPCFIGPESTNIIFAVVSIIAGMIVSFVTTWLLGFEDVKAKTNPADSNEKTTEDRTVLQEENENIKACVSGKVIPVEEIGDGVFSEKVLGSGVGIIPENDTIVAPCDGEISTIMEDSRHAVGISLDNGAEILIHEGIDTVSMNGEGFEMFVKSGDKVKAGQKLIKFDPKLIQEKGLNPVCVFVVTNSDEYPDIQYMSGIDAVQGETVVIRF